MLPASDAGSLLGTAEKKEHLECGKCKAEFAGSKVPIFEVPGSEIHLGMALGTGNLQEQLYGPFGEDRCPVACESFTAPGTGAP